MEHLTNKWDKRFMALAELVSGWSKDPKHKVGAVIAKNNRTLSEGYNGPPPLVIDHGLPRHIEVARTLHAELNAIILAKCALDDATMYVYPFFPCAPCASAIIQSGIKRVFFHEDTYLKNWRASQAEAVKLFNEAGVVTRKI